MMNPKFHQAITIKLWAALLLAVSLASCDGSTLPSNAPSTLGCETYKGQKLQGVFRLSPPNTTPPAGELPVFQLPTDSTTVHYTLGDNKPQQATLTCNDGAFEIVNTLEPTDIIATQGLESGPFVDVFLKASSEVYTFLVVGQQETACTQEYAPVCAVTPLGVDDFCDTDCPFGTLQTFANTCSAEAQGALIMQKSDCGEKEGRTYTTPD